MAAENIDRVIITVDEQLPTVAGGCDITDTDIACSGSELAALAAAVLRTVKDSLFILDTEDDRIRMLGALQALFIDLVEVIIVIGLLMLLIVIVIRPLVDEIAVNVIGITVIDRDTLDYG